ncbi:Hypothetical predicted protein, partial [Mytilus galloprovincialis]
IQPYRYRYAPLSLIIPSYHHSKQQLGKADLIDDINNLVQEKNQHEISSEHISSIMLDLACFNTKNINRPISRQNHNLVTFFRIPPSIDYLSHIWYKDVTLKFFKFDLGVPSECYLEQMTITESVRYWMVSQLSWQHDPCEKYHTVLLVDPLWEITPLMVLSSVITRSLLHPIELFFEGIGKSLRLFFNEIPAQWQPVMLIVIVVVSLLTIVMMCGYKIKLPFILHIEPNTPCKTKSKNDHDSIDGHSKTK